MAGGIVIITNRLSERGERIKAAQEWYERTFIIEGIDPILVYFHHYALPLAFSDLNLIDSTPAPIEAFTRIQVLCDGDVTPLAIAGFIRKIMESEPTETKLKIATHAVSEMIRILSTFRKELLETASTKVNAKHYKVNTSSIEDSFSKILDQMMKAFYSS